MNDLYIIEPDGTYTTQSVHALPTLTVLQELLGGYAQHVTVLWQGKRAHLFVDEDGLGKGLRFNARATALYHNATRRHCLVATYDSLTSDPEPFILLDAPPIVGRALFWPHSAPDWEPGL